MYEHGLRLGQELPGIRGLQRQVQCYLAAMHALRLVKPEYAWVVKPIPRPHHLVCLFFFFLFFFFLIVPI